MQMTSTQWQNMEQRDAYQRLIETVCVLHRLANRLSSRAEIVGAVRQVQQQPTNITPLNVTHIARMDSIFAGK